MAYLYSHSLLDAGFDVFWLHGSVASGEDSLLGEVDALGCKRVELHNVRGNLLSSVRELRKILQSIRPDAVLAFQQADRVPALIASRLLQIPSFVAVGNIHSFHGSAIAKTLKSAIYGASVRTLPTQLLPVSEVVADELRQRFSVPNKRITTIYNGIDFPTATPEERRLARQNIRQELHIGENETVLSNVGRIHSQKGQDILLRSLDSVSNSEIGFKMLIVGDLDDAGAQSIDAQKYEQGLTKVLSENPSLSNNVHRLGWRTDVPAILLASDIYVHPSRWEGWPLALLEAMGLGLPSLFSDCSGVPPGFIDGEHGFVVEAGNAEALTNSLKRILKTDRDELNAIGAAGQALVTSQFDISTVGAHFAETIKTRI